MTKSKITVTRQQRASSRKLPNPPEPLFSPDEGISVGFPSVGALQSSPLKYGRTLHAPVGGTLTI